MLNTAPHARYDLPWKAALTHAFRPFMDFYFSDFSARIDWRQRPRFRDKELARLGLCARPDVMVADKLAEVCLRDGGGRRVLVHIEIQAQRDPKLARRMRDYNDRISEAYGLPVISLALLADEHPNWRPRRFRQLLPGTVKEFTFSIAKLLDYAADIPALEASNNPIAWVTLAHWHTQQAHHDPDKLYAAKMHLNRLVFQHRWNRTRIIALLTIANWMMTLPEPHHQRYLRAIARLEKEDDMRLYNQVEQTYIDNGIRIGLERGRKEGLEQGVEQGRRLGAGALLERQLEQRFGPLPQTARRKLAKASVEQLENWSDALATAQSLKQVWG
ncbi:DUF4351 domain-containing protein [Duganella radicis]|uniref:DUF4351 domain-containing protein n=1 Tax=Duganella radicis TaxID=551988 RepID=A0A6L6PKN0_9BURK|nr:DUF4351 domain-containing protein [Duganella radicis]MTV39513.1 DUF4351 domain-containing protein [Duganella radicis]